MSHTPWTVKSVSGFAGGTKRKAGVTLYIETESDTVEDVRRMVESTPDLLAACELIYGMYEWSIKRNRTTLDLRSLDWNVLHNAIAKAKGA